MAVDPSGTLLASGSFDNNLKVWGASLQERSDEADDEGGDSKRAKGGNQAVTRTPVMTLAGHKEGISGVCWEEDKSSVVTASWDHTIRVWDTEMGGMKTELVGNKSFFDVAYSPKVDKKLCSRPLIAILAVPVHTPMHASNSIRMD